MSGGIYEGRPFSPNIKCVVFTALMAGGYWYLPSKNVWILLLLLWLPYVALAWYDFTYACADGLKPTIIPLGRWLWLPFKPAPYQAEFRKMAQAQVDTMDKLDHAVGWTALVGILAGVYYWRR